MTETTPTAAPDQTNPPKRIRITPARLAAWSLVLFVLTGALIVWTPIFLLCLPLWVLPAFVASIALGKLMWDFKDGLHPTHRVTAFVTTTALLLIVHVLLGGSTSWLRLGVAIRLWRVGGVERVEQWVQRDITQLRSEWDAMGGEKGLEKLSHDEQRRFLFRPKDLPDWLMPLRSYLPARISHDSTGRPDGIAFELAGWDHGWGLTVLCEPSSYSQQKPWPARLSDRSYLRGNP